MICKDPIYDQADRRHQEVLNALRDCEPVGWLGLPVYRDRPTRTGKRIIAVLLGVLGIVILLCRCGTPRAADFERDQKMQKEWRRAKQKGLRERDHSSEAIARWQSGNWNGHDNAAR